MKAALVYDPGESTNVHQSMYCTSSPCSLLTYPRFSAVSLPASLLSPCVACCETDGEGKDDRQTEGAAEREAENDQVGKVGNHIQRARDGDAER